MPETVVVNITPATLTDGSSLGYTAYNDLQRVKCFECDSEPDCPECPNDSPFKIPVADTDLLYYQYNVPDEFNSDPTNPIYGWPTNDPSNNDYFIKATLEFTNGATLELFPDAADGIIHSQSVGYYNSSFQNLVLSARNIQLYIDSLAVGQMCFRLHIETQSRTGLTYGTADFMYDVLPDPDFPVGTTVVVGALVYIIDNEGAWEILQAVNNGDIYWIQNSSDDFLIGFYELDTGAWRGIDPEFTVIASAECFSAWHVFVLCETTVLLEGVHGLVDCLGRYYAAVSTEFQSGIAFRDQYRIVGEFTLVGFPTDRTSNEDGVVISFIQKEEYTLIATDSVPEFYAKKIANTITATSIFIDGTQYINPSDLTKNNDEGRHWFPNLKFERISCESPNTCEGTNFNIPIVLPSVAECPPCPECVTEISFDVFLDGVLNQSGTLNILVANTINISI